jgi:hypothetical protein
VSFLNRIFSNENHLIGIDPSNQMKSTVNELDELFGSIRVTSDSKVNIPLSSNPSGNTEQLDDCLPLFPTANTNTNKTNNQSNISIFRIFFFIFIIVSTNESTATKKGSLFDDLQDLLVDQSTGQKISLTKR